MCSSFDFRPTSCEKCTNFSCKLCRLDSGNDWEFRLVRVESVVLHWCTRAWSVGTSEESIFRFKRDVRGQLLRVHAQTMAEMCVRDITNLIVKLRTYYVAYGGVSDYKPKPPKRVAVEPIEPVLTNEEELEKNILLFAEHIRRHISQVHEPTMVPQRCAQRARDLTNWIVKLHAYPVAHGGFSDVWKCQLRYKQELPKMVAVKAIRPFFTNKEELQVKQKAIGRELNVWAVLRHRNILPLYGITNGFGPLTAFVCPWADNGTLSEYLEKFESQLDLKERMTLLGDIAAGLQYFHGDLSSSNILIDESGTACLSDFGFSTLLEVSETYVSYPGNVRWAAPELLTEGTLVSQLSSTQADIYSFGSIMLQILSGKLPFHGVQRAAQIVIMVSHGSKPSRELLWDGRAIPNVLWEFVEACWASPSKRPSSEKIVHFIGCQLSRF